MACSEYTFLLSAFWPHMAQVFSPHFMSACPFCSIGVSSLPRDSASQLVPTTLSCTRTRLNGKAHGRGSFTNVCLSLPPTSQGCRVPFMLFEASRTVLEHLEPIRSSMVQKKQHGFRRSVRFGLDPPHWIARWPRTSCLASLGLIFLVYLKEGWLVIILPSFLDSCEESSPSTTSFIYDTGIMVSNSLYSLVGEPSKDTEYKVPGT